MRVAGMVAAGILGSRAGQVRLLRPGELPEYRDPGGGHAAAGVEDGSSSGPAAGAAGLGNALPRPLPATGWAELPETSAAP